VAYPAYPKLIIDRLIKLAQVLDADAVREQPSGTNLIDHPGLARTVTQEAMQAD
jgi:hypothetical protein